MEEIRKHKDLRVYKLSSEAGMAVFQMTKSFPKEETYSLKDQIRRSSRYVSGNIAEAWKKRVYPKSFVSKLNDSEGEAADPPAGGWLDYALACEYIKESEHEAFYDKYEHIIAMLVNIQSHPEKWQLKRK